MEGQELSLEEHPKEVLMERKVFVNITDKLLL